MTTPKPLSLAGPWQLSDGGDHACPMMVPGDAITALHDAGLIPDPYWGRNEYDLRWICDTDWTLRRDVVLEDTDYDLVIGGLDTVAEVWINGEHALSGKNAFRQYRTDISHLLRAGTNQIEVRFPSVVGAAAAVQGAQPFPVPNSKNCPIPNGNMLRKPACDFGWDWNIALAPFGINDHIGLVPGEAPSIEGVRVTQVWSGTTVTVHVTVDCWNVAGATLTATMDGQTRQFGYADDAHAMMTLLSFNIEEPRRWWPAGQGEQHLYDLTLTLGDEVRALKIGLRTLTLDTWPDADGAGFAFRVNDRLVFAKGANWIPADALSGRITPDKVRALLQSAVDANMNMIRIWGGGRYEPDWFYDICDELGLMVWQDFMFACNLYPSTPDFLAEVRAEVKEAVVRLQRHACLALWCGDNELIGALDWYEVSRTQRDRYLVSYDRLNRTIETALKEVAPEANWWPSSPSLGPMSFGDAWHDDGSGDMHFWSVWHEGRDFDHYRDVSPRFCSEFGFQSYPSMNVIKTFADPEDWNIAAPVLESHQKNAGGNARIAETMFRYFRWPARFEDFVYLSQVQQGLAIHTAVTHWRAQKPRCMGTLYWQLNDTWPVCSWSSLDYGGGWKLLHHMARRFYAPTLVSAVPDVAGITLRAINDTPGPVTLTVSARAVAMDGGSRPLGQASVTVGDAAVDALHIPSGAIGDQEILAFTWDGPGTTQGDIHAPRPFKSYDLRPPGIEHSTTHDGSDWQITLTARALALFVAAEADVPGRFSTNAVPLFPGHPVTIRFTPADPAQTPVFTLRDLHSATHT